MYQNIPKSDLISVCFILQIYENRTDVPYFKPRISNIKKAPFNR